MEEIRERSRGDPMNKAVIWVLFFAAGILLNEAGHFLAETAGLPLYLDTVGTVAVSAVCGYLPGSSVGFATNLIMSISDGTQMYYGFINIIMSLITCYFVEKGFFSRLYKLPLPIIVYTAAGSVFSSAVNVLLGYSADFALFENIPPELADKGIDAVIVFLAVSFVPKKITDMFKNEKYRIMTDNDKRTVARFFSLRTKLFLMLSLICLLTAGTILTITFFEFEQSEIDRYSKFGDSITGLMKDEIDPDKVDEYIEKGFGSAEYCRIYDAFNSYRKYYPDMRYIYSYRMLEDCGVVVFDVDTEDTGADYPGDEFEYEPEFAAMLPDLLEGREIDPIITENEYGYLLSVYKPVFDSSGKCACYVCVDFSMGMIGKYNRRFIARIMIMFAGFLLFIYVLSMRMMEKNVIIPVNTMAYCAGSFIYDSDEEIEENVNRIRELGIKTGDEIENLYHSLVRSTEDSMRYMEDLRLAQTQVQSMEEQVSRISRTAYRDALTGVKNKAAYNKEKEKLLYSIGDGTAEFAVVMIDLNDLKKVNDTYGHKNGDHYIKGACGLICNIYSHSPVFRIGGDEFVVILTEKSYKERDVLYDLLTKLFHKLENDETLEPWERFSAAVGMAIYDPQNDIGVDQVFTRADDEMYKNKVSMKKNRG